MMTPVEGPVVKVKPRSDIYTVLLGVAVLVLALAIGVVIYDLIQNYGMSFTELFTRQDIPST